MSELSIIADIGSNWLCDSKDQSDLEFCRKQIRSAAECGATHIKFQLFTHEELYGFPDESWPLNKFALPRELVPHLADACASAGVEFMCSAFSEDGVKFIDPFVKRHKIASCENSHIRLIKAAKDTGKPVIVSAGCAHGIEIRALIENLKIDCVMDCVSSYPADPSDYGLPWLRNLHTEYWKYGFSIGLSDHTDSMVLPAIAVALGCTVFEMHFSAFRVPGSPDQNVSLNPFSFTDKVLNIRRAAVILESKIKHPRASENDIVVFHRRRLKAIKDIHPGDRLDYSRNFGIFRSKDADPRAASGFSVDQFEGRTSKVFIKKGDGIFFPDIE